MKKLIALAVAAAAMPAMAAVSISGAIEVSYSDTDAKVAGVSVAGGAASTAAAASKTMGTEQATLTVSASSEMDNGMTVSTSYTFKGAGDAISNDGGEGAITVAGAFGSLSVGDVAGPLDARDGQAAAAAENDLSAAFGADMSAVYTLPNLAEGLNISVGMSAENGGDTGVATDATGIGFDYSIAGFKVYYGQESSVTNVAAVTAVTPIWISGVSDGAADSAALMTSSETVATAGSYTVLRAGVDAVAARSDDNEVVGYGASYTINGLTVAANFAEKEVDNDGTVTEHEKTAYGVKYTTGALSLAYNTLEDETDGEKTEESTTVSLGYSLGGGASVYAASTTRDMAKNDETTVGIKFAF